LFSVVAKATDAAATAGILAKDAAATERFALLLHYSTSAAVGCGLVIGCLRIVMGWPLIWFVFGGYTWQH
jgi:hypothetical protein